MEEKGGREMARTVRNSSRGVTTGVREGERCWYMDGGGEFKVEWWPTPGSTCSQAAATGGRYKKSSRKEEQRDVGSQGSVQRMAGAASMRDKHRPVRGFKVGVGSALPPVGRGGAG